MPPLTMKNYVSALLLCLGLVNCQPKKTENNTEKITAEPAAVLDSVFPTELPALPPNRTATRLDSTGDAASAPTSLAVNASAEWRIGKSRVGPIRVGMAVNTLLKTIPAEILKEVPITREGRGNRAYEIRRQAAADQPSLLVEETCEPICKVWRIHVQDPAFKTKEGLGVGSTLAEVKKHYKISYLGAGETEIVAIADEAKITFLLDVSKVSPAQVPRLNVNNTPGHTPVIGLLIL
ncbi:MAG: hypothetical protein AVDCRST_MAG95-1295 [uncultured Adhaeribacter sp.]|uniref:Uncharacterized protein n=1 Tax=uncultured Adhaeribacter sp. TaxID=448109 RepID=A0A6J4I1V6_9BACT|nr:MAG: hypothetical protein AVDCRST_MAG95-1295 [uncultured Adhaeribacter sp.]